MTEFHVDPQAVLDFGAAMGADGLGAAADAAVSYQPTWTDLPGGDIDGLFLNFKGIADSASASAAAALTHLRTVLDASGTELTAAGELYRTLDEQAAAAKDATY